jgi:hypothetical protein
MNSFFCQYFCEGNQKFSAVIEDDGKVCYAYLMEHQNIIGDIWLYNSAPTPSVADWSNRDEMPFPNSAQFTDLERMPQPINDPAEVKIHWTMNINGFIEDASIFIQGRLVAKMKPGFKPGWSTVVLKDGPLANKL